MAGGSQSTADAPARPLRAWNMAVQRC